MAAGKLIVVVGNAGAGKTTLTRALCRLGHYAVGLEQHDERPFQALFAHNRTRYALPNQIDYLLLRAEQERTLRQSERVGVHDGGLDLDYHVFTKYFLARGYLAPEEYELCARLYGMLRALLPPPDLVIYLKVPVEIVARRHARRGRTLEIAAVADLAALDRLLADWLCALELPLITVDASQDDACEDKQVRLLLYQIEEALRRPSPASLPPMSAQ